MDLPDDRSWKNRCDDACEYFAQQGITGVERIHCCHGKSWKVSGSPDNIYLLDGKPEEKFCIGQGKIANFISHIIVLNSCLRMSEDYFLLLECDAKFLDDWKYQSDLLLNNLSNHDPDWDLCYLGSCCARDKKPQQIKDRLHFWPYLGDKLWQYGPQCNHAWIVAKKSIPIILETQIDTSNPFDVSMLKYTSMHLKTYGAIPRLVEQFNTYLPE